MTPYVGAPAVIGQNILVAWNGSREAARAAHDAMPFLRRAKVVQIVTIDLDEGLRPGLELFVTHLARHGVAAKPHRLAWGGLAIGDVLLNAASDAGVDLIVMVAYGHSRMRELVLGGATRTLVRQMTTPVLFSH